MHTREVDGVPVFWRDAPGPLRAGLLFGCGTRDETFLTIGVTRLVAQLASPRSPGSAATVTLSTTEFRTTGEPDRVVAFLRAVARAVVSPSFDLIGPDEDGYVVHPTGAVLLTRRFGARDVGLETYAGPGRPAIGPDAVRAHLARFFVAENAALWLTGPPPDDLRLPLPRGIRPRRPEPDPVPQDRPQWSHEPVPSPGLLLSGTREPVWSLVMTVLEARVRPVAPTYGASVYIGPHSREYLLGVDSGPAAEALWAQTVRLALDGPTDAELAAAKAVYPADDPAAQARASLFDLPSTSPEVRQAEIDAVTPDDVRTRLDRALPTALVALPTGVRADLPGMVEGGCPRRRVLPYGERFPMRPLVRLLAPAERPAALNLTEDGLGRLDPDGAYHEARFSDVLGVDVTGRDRVVYAVSGCVFPVIARAYRDGDVLVEAIDAAVDPAVRYASDARPVPTPKGPGRRGRRRAGWIRLLDSLAALGAGTAAAALYLDWRDGDGPLWLVGLAGLIALVCLWDARPGRRRRRPPRRPAAEVAARRVE